jgi:hypothetical protein
LSCVALAASSHHAIRDFCSHRRYLRLKASSDRGERFRCVPFFLSAAVACVLFVCFNFVRDIGRKSSFTKQTDKSRKSRNEGYSLLPALHLVSCLEYLVSYRSMRVLLGLALALLWCCASQKPGQITTTTATTTTITTTNLLSCSRIIERMNLLTTWPCLLLEKMLFLTPRTIEREVNGKLMLSDR